MTDQDKIKALAELDGWTLTTKSIPVWTVTGYSGEGEYQPSDRTGFARGDAFKLYNSMPQYLTSYDAIIPLILRQDYHIKRKVFDAMEELLDEADFGSPTQLADALLVATGKMKGTK